LHLRLPACCALTNQLLLCSMYGVWQLAGTTQWL